MIFLKNKKKMSENIKLLVDSLVNDFSEGDTESAKLKSNILSQIPQDFLAELFKPRLDDEINQSLVETLKQTRIKLCCILNNNINSTNFEFDSVKKQIVELIKGVESSNLEGDAKLEFMKPLILDVLKYGQTGLQFFNTHLSKYSIKGGGNFSLAKQDVQKNEDSDEKKTEDSDEKKTEETKTEDKKKKEILFFHLRVPSYAFGDDDDSY